MCHTPNILDCPTCLGRLHPFVQVVMDAQVIHIESVADVFHYNKRNIRGIDVHLFCSHCNGISPLPGILSVAQECITYFEEYALEEADCWYLCGQANMFFCRNKEAFSAFSAALNLYDFLAQRSKWWDTLSSITSVADIYSNKEHRLVLKDALKVIPYEYANPNSLDAGLKYVHSIPTWFERMAKAFFSLHDYDLAEQMQERALDFYCDPILEYHDEDIYAAKVFMRDICAAQDNHTYSGTHNIDNVK